MDLAGLVDSKMRPHAFGVDRLAHRRQPGDLAFVPDWTETQRLGDAAVEHAQAVFRYRSQHRFLAAIEGRKASVRQMAVAVIDGIAAGIGGYQERILPRTVEQGRQRVGLVMIVEMRDDIVPEATITLKAGDVEKAADLRGAKPLHFCPHHPPGLVLDPRTELLAQPSDAADPAEIGGGEHGAAVSNRVDITPRRASDRQHLIDRE